MTRIAGCLSGSAGNVTATGNQYARYCIARDGHADANSPDQARPRDAMADAAKAWEDLTEAQRNTWHVYARNVPISTRCNPQTFLSGREWYCQRIILNRLFGSTDDPVAPQRFARPGFTPVRIVYPAGFAPPPPLTFQVHFNVNDAWASDPKASLCISFSNPVPQARTAWYRAYPNRARLDGTSGIPSSPATMAFPITPSNMSRVFWRTRLVSPLGVSNSYRPIEVRNPPL